MADFSVCISNALIIDQSILWGWLLGYSVDQMVNHKRQHYSQHAVPTDTLRCYILSQYQNFTMLQDGLHNPRYFYEQQFCFPLSPQAKKMLIERYYSFDAPVMRELLGKKMTTRARKDLDEVSDKTKIPLGSCRRQFDNLKRIMKEVEDDEDRSLIDDIRHHFMLTKEQASQYAHIIFITVNRLDTSKRKLAPYSFADLEFCGSVFMRYWISNTTNTLDDFDSHLAAEVRELKAIFLNDKTALDEYKALVSKNVASHPNAPAMERVQTQFKMLLRNIASIGSGLAQSKEVRDLFINLVEKVVEPFTSIGWSTADMELFFNALITEFDNVQSFNVKYRKRYIGPWNRLITGVKETSIRLYRSPQLVRSFTR